MFPGKNSLALLISGILIVSLMTGAILGTRTFQDEDGYRSDRDRFNSLSEGPWPSFGRDQKNTGLSPYESGHVDGSIDWIHESGDWIWSSPAIGSNGTLYFGSNDNNLYAVDTEDGSEEWVFKAAGEIYSSPAISDDGTIYFGSSDNNLYALDPNGTEKWRFSTSGRVHSSPTIDDEGNIYFASYDTDEDEEEQGYLYSVNEDGELNWEHHLDSLVMCSPSLGEEEVYIGSLEGDLFAIDMEQGTESWRYSTGGDIYSSPSIGEDGTVYFGSYDGYLYALDPDGTEKWMYEIGSKIHPSPTIGEDGTLYVGSHNGRFHAVNEGELLWTFSVEEEISSSAALSNDGIIYFGSRNGRVYSLNIDGELMWSYKTANTELLSSDIGPYDNASTIYSSPAIGENGDVFINAWNGNTYAFTGHEEEEDIEMQIYREVEMSVKIAGRMHNTVIAEITEDNETIRSVKLEREPGPPQMETIVFDHLENSDYNLTLLYEGENKGANPVWITFRSGYHTEVIFENFNHDEGEEQLIEYDLSEEIGEMISKVREVHLSVEHGLDEGTILSYEWDLGDGSTAEGKNVTHVYDSPGEYEVILRVTFEDGESIVIERTLIIDETCLDKISQMWERFEIPPVQRSRTIPVVYLD